MRVFSRPGGIERLSLEARVIYSAFCVFMLIGYATSAWFYIQDGLGVGPSSASEYYLGADDKAPVEPDEAGPFIDLPEDAPATPMKFEKPARQVMETFHFHLFTIPVVLMIVGHLYMMCGISTRFKVWTIIIAHVATLVHVLTPPAIRFVSDGFAFLMFPSAVLMALTWIYMTALPLWEMWTTPPPQPIPGLE